MVHAQKVVLEILWQITKPRSKNVFKKWVLCDENQKIIAAVPQAGTRPPGQPDTPMALKCSTKLDIIKKMCPIDFEGHSSNYEVTQDKIVLILTQIQRFRTVTPVWIHALMALKWCPKLNVVQKRCPIDFEGHSSNFKVTQDKLITNFDPNWAFPDCNSMFDLCWLCSLFTSLWAGTPMVAVWLAMLPSGWKLEMKAGHSDAIIHKNGWIGIMGGALGILMLSASPTNTWFR